MKGNRKPSTRKIQKERATKLQNSCTKMLLNRTNS